MTDQQPVTRTYRNEQLAVLWQPALCTHCEDCIRKEAKDGQPRGLPEVFDLSKRPWVNINGADSEAIADQVSKCPSGALSYKWLEVKT